MEPGIPKPPCSGKSLNGELSFTNKCVAFLESLTAIGDNIQRTEESYRQALNRLKEGNGNLISQTLKLKELGVKSRRGDKEIPEELIMVILIFSCFVSLFFSFLRFIFYLCKIIPNGMEYGYSKKQNLSSVMQQWRNVRSRTGMNMLLSGGRMSENHR